MQFTDLPSYTKPMNAKGEFASPRARLASPNGDRRVPGPDPLARAVSLESSSVNSVSSVVKRNGYG